MTHNSPTSINVYKQCPRLYYYQFIKKMPSIPHIDLVKGAIVHESLKGFFSDDPPDICKDYNAWAVQQLKYAFIKGWDSKKREFKILAIKADELKKHYDECWQILEHWLSGFLLKLFKTGLNFIEAFEKIRPKTEVELYFKQFDIRGFADVIEEVDGEVIIVDYKTSSKFEMTKENKLQIAIYAYLYEKQYGRRPSKVGIYFLKERLHLISVDEAMIRFAEEECRQIYEKTLSDDIVNYPRNSGYLCKSLKDNCPCRRYEEYE